MSEIIEKFLLYKALMSKETVIGKSESIYEFYDLRKIGEGASCCTYLAVDQDRHNVVIKELYPQRFRHLFERQDDGCLVFKQGLRPFDKERIKKQRDAFIREYLWQIEIQKHNSFTGGNRPTLYVSGNSLYNVMSYDGNPFTLNDAVSFANECPSQTPMVDYARLVLSELRNYAMELAVVHDMGCVVSDIKPGNVLITRSDLALSYRRMIDYGSVNRLSEINVLADGQVLDPSLFSYTQQFAAPEVISRQYSMIGSWSDVYSFGLTVMSFLLGNIIENPSVYLSCTLEDFREILLFNDCCGTLSGKDAGFITRLYNFCQYTLATEVMKTDITPDKAFMLMQSQGTKEIKRIRNMRCVIRMLDALLDDIGTGTNEPEVRQRAAALLKKFQDNSYGMPGERENNALLFSEKLLPVLEFGDESFPFVSLFDSNAKYSLISGAFHSVYIEGKSGSGKTTALQYFACQTVGLENGPIPVWVSLYDLFMSGDGNRSEQLRQYISDRLFGSAAYDETAERHDEELDKFLTGEGGRPRLLLIFDGLNEAAMYGSDVSDWLAAISEISNKSNVISVISGHDQTREFRSWKGRRMNVLPCSRSVAEEYLADLTRMGRLEWYPDQLDPEIVERTMSYLDSPMLLHYFAVRYLDIPIDETQLPRNKALLIEQYLTALGRNCVMERIHRMIAGESMQSDIPYGDFLLTSVAGNICLFMIENQRYEFSCKDLQGMVDDHLSYFERPDGTTAMAIGDKFISTATYNKMVSFDSDGNNGGSWISYLFVSNSSDYFSVTHETIGVYLAARFLALVIGSNDTFVLPEPFQRHDLPEDLIEMTAMLLEYNDICLLKTKINRTFGRIRRHFMRDVTNDILINITPVSYSYRTYNIQTAGNNFHRLVNKMDNLSRMNRFTLLFDIPDNRANCFINSFMSRMYKKGTLTDAEKEKLGTTMRKVASQPEVLAAARLLWKKNPELHFKSDMDVLEKAFNELTDVTSKFLASKGIHTNAVGYLLMMIIGQEAVFEYEDIEKDQPAECSEMLIDDYHVDPSEAQNVASELLHMLHGHPLLCQCPRLYNVMAAFLIRNFLAESYCNGEYAEILTCALPTELLYETANVVFAEFAEIDENYYPEKKHAEILSSKSDVYQYHAVIKEDEGKIWKIDFDGGLTEAEHKLIFLSQFCAVEHEIFSQGCINGVYKISQEQLNVLTQMYVILNYAICKGHIGRMADCKLRFEKDGIAGKAECAEGVSSNGRMCEIVAMMGLGMYRSVSLFEYILFKLRYIWDYKYINLRHLDKWLAIRNIAIGAVILLAVLFVDIPLILKEIPVLYFWSFPILDLAKNVVVLIGNLVLQSVNYYRINKFVAFVIFGLLLAAFCIFALPTIFKINYNGYKEVFDFLKNLLNF